MALKQSATETLDIQRAANRHHHRQSRKQANAACAVARSASDSYCRAQVLTPAAKLRNSAIEPGKRPTCYIEIGHRSTTLSLLGMLSWKLGRGVTWDGEKEECPGDAEVNALLRRDYRDPRQYPGV